MVNKLNIALDFSMAQEADDGETCHYGGKYLIDGEEFQAYGDDRSDSWHEEAAQMIEEKIQAVWPDFMAWKEVAHYTEDLSDLQSLVLDVWPDRATLEVFRDEDGQFKANLVRL